MRRIKIVAESIGFLSGFLTDENPDTAKAVWGALPIEGMANLWGEEVYFSTKLSLKEESSRDLVKKGEIAYWPPGQALCFFFGPTPASLNQEIRAASPVNVFAYLSDDPTQLKLVKRGEKVRLERVLNNF